MKKTGVHVGIALALLLSACTTTHYRNRADEETYKIIEEKSPSVPGMADSFTIEQESDWEPLADVPTMSESSRALGIAAESEVGSSIVSLERALEIAVRQNRSYQSRKETLYLSALGLTLQRHNYTPIFSSGTSVDYAESQAKITTSKLNDFLKSEPEVASELAALTGSTRDMIKAYDDVVQGAAEKAEKSSGYETERTLSGSTNIQVDKLLKTGGRISLGLTANFLRYVSGDFADTSSSTLSGSFSQPLLRGAGSSIAAEGLTQSERNVLYALRDFTRYRQDFTVSICSDYYRVLRNRELVKNSFQSYESYKKNAEREEAFAKEGQRTKAQLGRIQQEELNSENSWTNAIRVYKESLDSFKIQLGLSTDAAIVLDEGELTALSEAGLNHPDITAEEAGKVALTTRLDFQTQQDQVEDVERRVKIAINALKPNVNYFLGASVPSKGSNNFGNLDFDQYSWSTGLDVDLPLDQKSERNSYRSSLISYERALRDLSLAEDRIKLDLRASWRNLEQARISYEIAKQSLTLSESRVDEQNLRAELGNVTLLDLIDAQQDYTQAQNNLTNALVSHTISRLSFWRDMGILYIKDNGQWEEPTHEQ